MILDILVIATYLGLVYLMGKSRANERLEEVESKDKFKA